MTDSIEVSSILDSAFARGRVNISITHENGNPNGLFITTDQLEFSTQCQAISRLGTALFQGGEPEQVLDGLYGIGDPTRGIMHSKGNKYSSFYAEVKEILEGMLNTLTECKKSGK